jgi:AraC family transcriptional regulator of adaptative response/methylated-DNA-[protein]-cysteine methyltransferase
MQDLREDSLWDAVKQRDASYSGVFYFGVKTTGVYCRPGCPSPIPRRENVVFAFSPSSLALAGFRPCRRCHPDDSSRADSCVATVVNLCRFIEESETVPSSAELAARAGLSVSTLNRLFGQALGVTPREYADAHRRERFRRSLRAGAGVLEAAMDAGYGSTSRVYEGANHHLGMTPGQYRNGGQGQRLGYSLTETPLGWLLVAATSQGISAVKLGDDPSALVQELRTEFPRAALGEGEDSLRAWTNVLVDYLSGGLPWRELPYDVRATAFQRRVWQFLRSIPSGSTMHYSEVAAALGTPTATRAVARACATNPVALVVPCHRVVPRGPGFAGFRWGIERKRRLLELEGSPEARR